jgi:hypothetical protein
MYRRAESGGRWATVHPAADVIRVGDQNGARFDLACDWPTDAGWAGDSLVAVTAHGTAMLFSGIGKLLDGRCPSEARSS